MAELKKEQFVIKGKDTVRMESISRPSLSFWSDAWRRLRKNKSAVVGLCIVAIYAVLAIFAPIFSPYTQSEMDVNSQNALFQRHTGLDVIPPAVICGPVSGWERAFPFPSV